MRIKDRLLPLITIALVLAFWYVAALIYGVEIVLPSPTVAFKELVEIVQQGAFWVGVGNTFARSLVAFALAFVLALIFALVSVWSKSFYKLFYPVIVLLRAIPTISVIFVCYMAIRGWYRAVLIAFLIIFPTLYSSFYTSITGCRGDLMQVSAVYQVKRRFVITKFIIPSVWASMYSEIVNTLSLTVKLIIAAEAVTSTGQSLGGFMAEAKAVFEMGSILAYTVVAVVLSYATELAVRLTVKICKEVSKKWKLH